MEASPKGYDDFIPMGHSFSHIKPVIKKCNEIVDNCSTTKVRIIKSETTVITQEELGIKGLSNGRL